MINHIGIHIHTLNEQWTNPYHHTDVSFSEWRTCTSSYKTLALYFRPFWISYVTPSEFWQGKLCLQILLSSWYTCSCKNWMYNQILHRCCRLRKLKTTDWKLLRKIIMIKKTMRKRKAPPPPPPPTHTLKLHWTSSDNMWTVVFRCMFKVCPLEVLISCIRGQNTQKVLKECGSTHNTKRCKSAV